MGVAGYHAHFVGQPSPKVHQDGRERPQQRIQHRWDLGGQATPLINPVTGEENEVHIVFPGGGLIWDDGDTATTSVMKVDHGDIKFDYTGQSAFFAPIEWTNQ